MRDFGLNRTNFQAQEKPLSKVNFSPCRISTDTIDSDSEFSENEENKAPEQHRIPSVDISPVKQDRQQFINQKINQYDGVLKDKHRGIRESLSSPKLFENVISLRFSDLYKPLHHKPLKGTTEDNVKVIVRVRPLQGQDKGGIYQSTVNKLNDNTISIGNQAEGQYFYFDYVAGPETNQANFFKMVGRPIVENCIAGYNSCVIAYGQTGSGKTHTMFGEVREVASQQQEQVSAMAGLVPRMIGYLMEKLKTFKSNLKDGRKADYQIICSYVEIYQEVVTDLLNPISNRLNIKEERNGKISVDGAIQEPIRTVDDIMAILVRGNGHKKLQETKMNKQSSRSHCILICDVIVKMTEGAVSKTKKSTLHLVDLAGSERQKLTNTKGKSLKEANFINKSLTALGLVILKLERGQKHISYRDSKLTYLLQNSLGGNAKTVFIANISQSSAYQSETNSTLGFAYRAKSIKNKAIVNEDTQKIQQAARHDYDPNSQFKTPTKAAKTRAQVSRNPQINQQLDQKHLYNQELQIQYVNIIREKQELQNQLISKEIDIDILRQKESQTQGQLIQARKQVDFMMQENNQLKIQPSVQSNGFRPSEQNQIVQNMLADIYEQVTVEVTSYWNQYVRLKISKSLNTANQVLILLKDENQSIEVINYNNQQKLIEIQKGCKNTQFIRYNQKNNQSPLFKYKPLNEQQQFPISEDNNDQLNIDLAKFTQLSKILANFNEYQNQQQMYQTYHRNDDVVNYILQNSSLLQQELYTLCRNHQQLHKNFNKISDLIPQLQNRQQCTQENFSMTREKGLLRNDSQVQNNQQQEEQIQCSKDYQSNGKNKLNSVSVNLRNRKIQDNKSRSMALKQNMLDLKAEFFAIKKASQNSFLGFQDFILEQCDMLKANIAQNGKRSIETRNMYSNFSDTNTLLVEKPSETQLFSNAQQQKDNINQEMEEYCHELEREKAELELVLKNKNVRMETLEESLRAITQERYQTNRQLFQFMNDLDERLNSYLKPKGKDSSKTYDDDSQSQQISAIYNNHYTQNSISIADNLRNLNSKQNIQNFLTQSMTLDPVDSLRKLCDKIQDQVLLIPGPKIRAQFNTDPYVNEYSASHITPVTPRTACEFTKSNKNVNEQDNTFSEQYNNHSAIARSIWNRQHNQTTEDDQMTTLSADENTNTNTLEPQSNLKSQLNSHKQDSNRQLFKQNNQDQIYRNQSKEQYNGLEQPSAQWLDHDKNSYENSLISKQSKAQNVREQPLSFNITESSQNVNDVSLKKSHELSKVTSCTLSDANLLEDQVSETTLDELLQTSQNDLSRNIDTQANPYSHEIQQISDNENDLTPKTEQPTQYGRSRRLTGLTDLTSLTENLILEKTEPPNSNALSMRKNLGDAPICDSPHSNTKSFLNKDEKLLSSKEKMEQKQLQQSIEELKKQISTLSWNLNSKIESIRGSIILDNSDISLQDVQKLKLLERQNEQRIQKITEKLQESIEEDKFCCLRILYVPQKYEQDVQKLQGAKNNRNTSSHQNKNKSKQRKSNGTKKQKKRDSQFKYNTAFINASNKVSPTYEQKENMRYLENI